MVSRIVLFTLLWYVLAGVDTRQWLVSVAIVLVATYLSFKTIPRGALRVTPVGIAIFLPAFLWYSVRGGLDVALRAVLVHARTNPGMVDFRTRLPEGPARSFFAAVIGLQPGSLTAQLEGDTLRVHLLDRRTDVQPQLRDLEDRVARLFRLPAAPP